MYNNAIIFQNFDSFPELVNIFNMDNSEHILIFLQYKYVNLQKIFFV